MNNKKKLDPNSMDQCWLERMRKEENHKLKSIYRGMENNLIDSLPVSDKFAEKINSLNPSNTEFIPSAVSTEYYK